MTVFGYLIVYLCGAAGGYVLRTMIERMTVKK